jgi:4-hydroxybenzoate polyprenyltransferase
VPRLFKSHRWWDYKVPPLLALAYYAIYSGTGVRPISVITALWHLALFLVAVVGIAGFGHLFTDAFDVAEDRAGGRENDWQRLGAGHRFATIAVLLAASLLPWLLLPLGAIGWGLIALEFGLFAAYAVPPVRLKERGLPGIVADGLYAHAVPLLVTWLTFSHLASVPAPLWLGAVLTTWALALGMRHLLQHQADDVEADRLAGVATFAVRRGRRATFRFIAGRLLPVEIIAFLALVVLLSQRMPVVALGFVAHVVWEACKLRVPRMQPFDRFGGLDRDEKMALLAVRLLSRFYERWLPLLVLFGLVVRAPEYLLLFVLHVLLFKNALRDLVRQDLPVVFAHWRSSRGTT